MCFIKICMCKKYFYCFIWNYLSFLQIYTLFCKLFKITFHIPQNCLCNFYIKLFSLANTFQDTSKNQFAIWQHCRCKQYLTMLPYNKLLLAYISKSIRHREKFLHYNCREFNVPFTNHYFSRNSHQNRKIYENVIFGATFLQLQFETDILLTIFEWDQLTTKKIVIKMTLMEKKMLFQQNFSVST